MKHIPTKSLKTNDLVRVVGTTHMLMIVFCVAEAIRLKKDVGRLNQKTLLNAITMGNMLVPIISCKNCNYEGLATTYGGTKIGRPLHYLKGFPPGYKVINSIVDDKCPRCRKNWR